MAAFAEAAKLEIVDQKGWRVRQIRRLIAHDIDAGNTFDDPNRVHPKTVDTKTLSGDAWFTLKPHSVTTLRMTK